MAFRTRILAAAIGAAALLAAILPATAGAFNPTTDRETHLLSRSIDGGFPNGPSRNAVFAQNGQGASYVAYESDASDIVAGDSNGFTDVFVLRRGGKFTDYNGEPWQPAGAPQIVSQGMGGAPANGRSYAPVLDADAKHRKPHCVAFVSEASNLVPGDTNGKADAFIRDLRSQRIRRVSVGNRGVQSDGATYDVKIDGSCTRVAFTSDATNLYLSRKAAGHSRFKRPLITTAPRAGTKQVYVRFLTATKDNKGVTFLASSSKARQAGRRQLVRRQLRPARRQLPEALRHLGRRQPRVHLRREQPRRARPQRPARRVPEDLLPADDQLPRSAAAARSGS